MWLNVLAAGRVARRSPAGERRTDFGGSALRLAKALGTTPQLWLNLQNDYDVQLAKRRLSGILDKIEVVNKPKAA
jgi:plasmid maintenance system antidote protein VapI